MRINKRLGLYLFGGALIATLLVAAQKPQPVVLTPIDLQWLLGEWQGTLDGADISESWQQSSAELFLAQGFVYSGKDTFVREQLRIQKIANHWTFIPVINDQPPVLFTLVRKDQTTLVFENKEHDFPQRVVYAYEDGKLHAWIEGLKNENVVKEDYWYQKKP